MKMGQEQDTAGFQPGLRWLWIVGVGCVLTLVFLLMRPGAKDSKTVAAENDGKTADPTVLSGPAPAASGHFRGAAPRIDDRPAQEIVAEKVNRYAGSHQEIVAAMAKQRKIAVPPAVNEFFAAVQAGQWEQTTNLFAKLERFRTEAPSDFQTLWQAIKETYGVAEQAHQWPAQRLLDYGNSILETLRPGMVYVGGTDAGRFIPSLLTETSDTAPHIVLTQNALADSSYLDYLRFRFGDQMNALSGEDSQIAFQSYLEDARKRLEHDQQSPNENKQIRPGEDIQSSEGRIRVSGETAVMLINEQLLQKLLQKNPNLSYGLQESMPLTSLYAGATTLGPISELRGDSASPLTAAQAGESLTYWRGTTQSLLAEPESDESNVARNAYAKLVIGQANLFVDRKLSGEAEQAYQIANQLDPALPDAVFGYVQLLIDQKRFEEAKQIAQNALNRKPDDAKFRDLSARLNNYK